VTHPPVAAARIPENVLARVRDEFGEQMSPDLLNAIAEALQ
jgi:hypothetical protein